MPIAPVFTPCIDCCNNSIVISDSTGVYSASNTGGWGVPNETTGDVTVSSISIIDPNGNTTTHSATALPLSSITITAGDIVTGATTLTDGQYLITWSITADGNNYTAYSNPYSTCVVENCVTDKVADMDPDCDCGCEDCYSSATRYIATFEGLKAAITCGKQAKAAKLLEDLQDMCNNNCKDC